MSPKQSPAKDGQSELRKCKSHAFKEFHLVSMSWRLAGFTPVDMLIILIAIIIVISAWIDFFLLKPDHVSFCSKVLS